MKKRKIKIIKHKKYYRFQKRGILKIEALNGRALLADEMGLGKTGQAIGWSYLHPKRIPIIIVVPASLKIKWKRELLKWLPDIKRRDIRIIFGRKVNPKKLKNKKAIIINYDILFNEYLDNMLALVLFMLPITKKKKDLADLYLISLLTAPKKKKMELDFTGWVDYLLDIKPKILIFDECHKCKNEQAQRTKAIKKMSRRIKYIIAISGTPVLSKPIDIFPVLNILNRKRWPSKWDFAKKYCGLTHNGFGWDYTGASNTEELHDILVEDVMIRRLKKDVMKELPPKNRVVVPLEMDPTIMKEYRSAEADLINWIHIHEGEEKALKAMRAEGLVRIEKLKQLALKGKLNLVIEWIDSFLESELKLIVPCTHTNTIDILMKKYKKIAVRLDGKTSAKKRQEAEDSFQTDDKIKLIICNIKAAGEGIDLYAASNLAFTELGWTPPQHDQMEDRAHRIGQKDSVTPWYLIASDTIEEKIIELIDKKRKNIDAVMDGKKTEDTDLLGELLNTYRR